jgi:hypothetical protein
VVCTEATACCRGCPGPAAAYTASCRHARSFTDLSLLCCSSSTSVAGMPCCTTSDVAWGLLKLAAASCVSAAIFWAGSAAASPAATVAGVTAGSSFLGAMLFTRGV